MNVGNQTVDSNHWFPYYGGQWLQSTSWLPTFFKISTFVFNRRNKFIQVWNKWRVSKWWQYFNFCGWAIPLIAAYQDTFWPKCIGALHYSKLGKLIFALLEKWRLYQIPFQGKSVHLVAIFATPANICSYFMNPRPNTWMDKIWNLKNCLPHSHLNSIF